MVILLEGASPNWLTPYLPDGSFPLDAEALRIYQAAYFLAVEPTKAAVAEPPIGFTTVMAALLTGADPTSRWFAESARTLGLDASKVFAEKGIDEARAARSSAASAPTEPLVLPTEDKQLLTSSSRAVLNNAEGWAQKVGGSEIGVRHLLAAYLINPPPNHRRQLVGWGTKEESWRGPFFEWLAQHYGWERWIDAARGPAPTRGLAAFEAPVAADSLEWQGDTGATQVLERAAQEHAGRGDRDLPFTTLMYALIKSALDERPQTPAFAPLRAEMTKEKVRSTYDQWVLEYKRGYVAPVGVPPGFAQLQISPIVLNALETARELAACLGRGGNAPKQVCVGVRHLVAAVASRRVDAVVWLAEMGIVASDLRSALKAALREDESREVWSEVMGEEEPSPAGRPASLNSDEPAALVRADPEWKEPDPLGIRADVNSFASLLASGSLKPPLSIGLFGPWGSGKTTFLKRLIMTVDARANEAKNAQGHGTPSPYVANVVHVEFNAWHYAEQALISSLVDVIFRETRAFIVNESKTAGQEWLETKENQLESAKRRADAAKQATKAALAAVDKAMGVLADTRVRVSEKTASFAEVVRAIWNTTKSELATNDAVQKSGVLDAIGDVGESDRQLRDRLADLRQRPGRLLADLGWPRSLLFAALIVVVPPLAAWAIRELWSLNTAAQSLTTLTAALSILAMWAKSATDAVAKVDAAVAKVAGAYERALADDPDLRAAQRDVENARTAAEAAAAGVAAAYAEMARAEADVANASLPAQFRALLDRRVTDETYRRELTSLSTARADLEALSQIMRDLPKTKDGGAKESAGADRVKPVERIILYIDDLDRCAPKDVVRVLELVHMLLAFELFVVVVAVDARWVHASLVRQYPWLSKDDERTEVTSQDYLEKIFQIAFWLEPMNAARAASYLDFLGAQMRASALGGIGNISGVELDYLKALAADLGPSPRRVKRLINSYSLLKARLSETQLERFVSDETPPSFTVDDTSPSTAPTTAWRPGAYQLAIGLLVIGTGAADSARAILNEIAECDPSDTFAQLIQRFKDRGKPDWTMAARVLQTLSRSRPGERAAELRGWARKAARFQLQAPPESAAPVRSADRRREDGAGRGAKTAEAEDGQREAW
jgi:hypothetical protein